jgi:hypothetical protein
MIYLKKPCKMTEKTLKKLGFIKVKAKDSETNNGYDYYYYVLDITQGLSLASTDSDETISRKGWNVISWDIPDLEITKKKQLKAFIKLCRTVIRN